MGFEGYSFSEVRITGSTLTPDSERDSAVLVGGEATAADIEDGTAAWGTLGLVFRPRRPEPETGATDDQQTNELFAHAFAVRHGERLVPLGWRDPRLNRVYEPGEGSFAVVGYGGGYVELEDLPSKLTRIRLRVPYASGTKVLEALLDPDDESITLTHPDGMSIELKSERVKVAAPTVWIDSPDVRLTNAAGNQLARVGDLCSVAVPAMTAGGIPVIPVLPILATPTGGVQAIGQIISGKAGLEG